MREIVQYRRVRKIVHLEMDAFYASVEQRDNPALRGQPLAVGGGRRDAAWWRRRATRRAVRRALGDADGDRLATLPGAVIVRPDFHHYRGVSREVMEILRACTPLVEPLSLDEAYLDVTHNSFGEPLAQEVAKRLKEKIRDARA